MNMPMKNPSKFAGVTLAAYMLCASTSALAGFQWTPPSTPSRMEVPTPAPAAPVPPPTIIEGKPVATDSPEIVSPVVIEGTPSTSVAAAPAVTPSVAPTATAAPVPITPAPVVAPAAPAPVLSPAPVAAPAELTPKPDAQFMTPEAMEESEQIAVAPPEAPAVPAAPAAIESETPASMPFAVAAPAKPATSSVVRGFANRVPLTVALRQLLPPAYSFSVDEDVDMGVLVSFKGGKPWRETLTSALQPAGLVSHEQGQMVVISRMEPVKKETSTSVNATPPSVAAAVPNDATMIASSSAVNSPAANPVVFETVAKPASSTGEIAWTTQTPAAPAAVPVLPPASSAPAITPALAPATAVPPSAPAAPMAPDAPAALISAATDPVKVADMWTADRGDSLRKVLMSWSHRAHVEIEWLAEYDYPLQASVNLTGTYEDAVRNLLVGFEGAQPQPVAQLHTNAGAGQKVLVVRARGNTNKD